MTGKLSQRASHPYMRVGRPGHLKQHFFHEVTVKFDIKDIAWGLAKTARFLGSTKEHYSVAEHSLIGSLLCTEVPIARQFLLHDAHEFIFGDTPSPLKQFFKREFFDLQAAYQRSIYKCFDCSDQEHPEVKTVDDRMYATEQVVLRNNTQDNYNYEPYQHVYLSCMPWEAAYESYLRRFNILFPERAVAL